MTNQEFIDLEERTLIKHLKALLMGRNCGIYSEILSLLTIREDELESKLVVEPVQEKLL